MECKSNGCCETETLMTSWITSAQPQVDDRWWLTLHCCTLIIKQYKVQVSAAEHYLIHQHTHHKIQYNCFLAVIPAGESCIFFGETVPCQQSVWEPGDNLIPARLNYRTKLLAKKTYCINDGRMKLPAHALTVGVFCLFFLHIEKSNLKEGDCLVGEQRSGRS